ncbi:MAG: DUF4943 family protein [Bacteroidota bacterium]
MRTSKIFVILILLFILSGCNKDQEEIETTVDLDVTTYVELLKAGSYDSLELPGFTYQHIPALLEYRDEKELIRNFPVNGISSLLQYECRLGMYVLWTIESIRAVAIDSKFLIGRFPSQNPIVEKIGVPFEMTGGDEAHEIVSEAYYNWWVNNGDKNFSEFKGIDPLTESGYQWH